MRNYLVRLTAIGVFGLTCIVADPSAAAPNVLLIIGDDIGVEALSVYGLNESTPTTASLDRLAHDGVVFRNFWSQPVCSPTRATIMTGRYGFRTGVGRPIAPAADGGASGPLPEPPPKLADAPYERSGGARRVENPLSRGLRPDEFMLPMAIRAGTGGAYKTAAIGKWHLADVDNGWLDHPRRAGIDYYSIIMHGFESYFSYPRVVNGVATGRNTYSAIDNAESAIEWITEQADNPWFMWLSFILPHTPLHLPPKELLQSDYSDLSGDVSEDPIRYFQAMVEAMDTQIGRVLASMKPEVRENTYVIFIGDNGTGSGNVAAPFRSGHAKGTVYQGGVNVPLIVAGPGVASGRVSEALVNSTDLFSTILEMVGTNIEDAVPDGVTLDSVSFFPYLSNPGAASRREWVYADVFPGSFAGIDRADYAMRDSRFKLLRNDGVEEFYDLVDDPYEHKNLLEGQLSAIQREHYQSLTRQIQALRASK